MPVASIPARLFEQARVRPASPAYYERADGAWRPTSWALYAQGVAQCAKALHAAGIKAGDTIGILGFNRPEWAMMDLGAMSLGAVPAGIYTTCSAAEVQYIMHHAGARIVLLENASQWAKINEQRAEMPNLERVVMMRNSEAITDDVAGITIQGWDEFLAMGADVDDAMVPDSIAALTDHQLATLIYTSGTTGPPKAVMLSVKNLAWTAETACKMVDLDARGSSISYLPMSHIAEQVFTIHGPITAGSQVYYAESLQALPEHLKDVQPTVLFGVPRIWEKFHAGLTAKLAEATGAKAKLVKWAMGVGRRVAERRNQGKSLGPFLAAEYRLADKLIYAQVKTAIGLGRAEICISGAAPITKELLEFFSGLDITVHEVYGQSEDTGPTTFNQPGMTRLGTVGPRVPGVEVVIADDGEILVRGPNVFMGYYNDEAATAAALDADGWLHSGDLGAFDGDFLTITGRKKEIIITAGGKNIAPKNIEAALKNLPLVAEAVIIGDRRRFLSALLTLDEGALGRFAEGAGISGDHPYDHAEVQAEIQRGVAQVNALFARVEHVRKFAVLPRNFTVESGELTPSLKIKRRVINAAYSEIIEALYV